MVPLVIFTGSRKKMGEFVNGALAAGAGLVHGGPHCRAECLAADPNRNGPLTPHFPSEVTHDINANDLDISLSVFFS